MKKLIALVLSVMMLCAAFAAAAEESAKPAPLYATVGEALKAAGEQPVAGGEKDYFAVVTEKDGKYYRSVAETDDRAKELYQAAVEADVEQMEATSNALSEYENTLPITYSEEFTAVPMGQAELDALTGKTIGELLDMGYEERESGGEEDNIVYVLRKGLFDYAFTADADINNESDMNEWENGGKQLKVRSAAFRGITREACFKRFHTDGTVEELQDMFAGFGEITEITMAFIGKVEAAQKGEEVDFDTFGKELKEQYPDMAEMIDAYLEVIQKMGVDALAALLAGGATE